MWRQQHISGSKSSANCWGACEYKCCNNSSVQELRKTCSCLLRCISSTAVHCHAGSWACIDERSPSSTVFCSVLGLVSSVGLHRGPWVCGVRCRLRFAKCQSWSPLPWLWKSGSPLSCLWRMELNHYSAFGSSIRVRSFSWLWCKITQVPQQSCIHEIVVLLVIKLVIPASCTNWLYSLTGRMQALKNGHWYTMYRYFLCWQLRKQYHSTEGFSELFIGLKTV